MNTTIIVAIVAVALLLAIYLFMRGQAAKAAEPQTPLPEPAENRPWNDPNNIGLGDGSVVTPEPVQDFSAFSSLEQTPATAAADAWTQARSHVSGHLPDEVLDEMFSPDHSAQSVQQLAGLSPEMLSQITQAEGGVHYEGLQSDEDMQALSGLGSAIDGLDIWDFGDENEEPDAQPKA